LAQNPCTALTSGGVGFQWRDADWPAWQQWGSHGSFEHANDGRGQRVVATYFVSGLIVAALVVYLLYVLARPEKF
jgi:K+-transporting ATPase KdpF subunit